MAAQAKKRRTGSQRSVPHEGRLVTGIPGLDVVLDGGLLPRRVYLLQGEPGSGKTVLASQLCIEHARRGDACLYVTMLIESTITLIENLRSFSFYDDEVVKKRITFLSGYRVFDEGGYAALSEVLQADLRRLRARILVIDSLPHPRADVSDYTSKRFVRDLAAACALVGCTALLIAAPGSVRDETDAAADGVIRLARTEDGLRSARTIEVLKFRGSSNLEGRHVIDIGRSGMRVHPRLEAKLSESPPQARASRRRVRFGVAQLDQMMNGGVTEGSSTVMLGAPGAGKTLLGLQFLAEGARRGERVLYFGFYESPERVLAKGDGIGLKLSQHAREGRLELLWQPALEYALDALGERLIEAVQKLKARRVFVDGVDGFEAVALFSTRSNRFLVALTNQLRAMGATTLYSRETALFAKEVGTPPELSAIFENIFLLRYVELRSQLYRLFSILKMRESDYDSALREFRVTDSGLELANSFESAEAVLSGEAHVATGRRRP